MRKHRRTPEERLAIQADGGSTFRLLGEDIDQEWSNADLVGVQEGIAHMLRYTAVSLEALGYDRLSDLVRDAHRAVRDEFLGSVPPDPDPVPDKGGE